MLHHNLTDSGRVAEARAMIENAFAIQPADAPAAPVRGSRILEVLR